MLAWCEAEDITWHYIAPGKPMQNAFCESFNARAQLVTWAADYNTERPHSGLDYLTPAAKATLLAATGDRLRNPDQLRRSPVAPFTPDGVCTEQALIPAG